MSLLIASKKGKWIIGGVCVFALVATASTGLASWVIGQASSAETNGNISVSTVKDESCNVTLNDNLDLKVNFGPNKGDSTLYVHASEKLYGENWEEDLKFTIAGSLSNPASYKQVKISMDISNFKDMVGTYFKLPSVFEKEGETDVYSKTLAVTTPETGVFNYDFSFTWGSLTSNKNPSEYFTNANVKTTVTDGVGVGALDYLKALAAINNQENKTFKITVAPVLGSAA